MKITHLTSVHPPDDNRIFKICRSIANAGRKVSFVVPKECDSHVDGVEIKAVPRLSSRLTRMVLTSWRVYVLAVKERADIYQFHDPELIPVGLALRHLHNCDVIYDVHENVPDQILTKSYIPGRLRKPIAEVYDWLERRAARMFSAIVTANEDINERFRGCRRIVAIHNYAEVDEFGDAPEADSTRYRSGIILHSAASERTSFPAVLRALNLLPQNVPAILMTTGSTESESRHAAELAEADAPAGNRLRMLGTLPRNAMAQVFSQCAVSLVLYSDHRNHSSIRANRLFESLAAGAPVIVSDFPEWRALVESLECGLVADPNDPQSLANALHFFLANPEEAAAMGRRGRTALLESFNWSHEKTRLFQLYDSLIQESRPDHHMTVKTA